MHPISSKTKFVIAGAATAFVGLAVIFGWLFDWVVIRSVFLGGATMKLNTAACFVLLGLALIFIQYPKLKIGYVVCSIAVLVIALLSLSEYLFNWAAGMDEAFVKDTASQTAGIAHPGLMSPLTATCFCLIALALPGMRSAKRSALLTLQYALHLATLIAAIALFGYLFHAPSFSRFSFFTSIAVHTALLIFLFSITASLLHPTLGITGLFTGRLTGNVMFRRLFCCLRPFLSASVF